MNAEPYILVFCCGVLALAILLAFLNLIGA